MNRPEAMRRVLAGLADAVLASVVSAVPSVGPLLGIVYFLLRDDLPFEVTRREEWRGVSLGKRLFGLRVERLDGSAADAAASVKRNVPLCLGGFLALASRGGLFVAGPLGGPLFALPVLGLWGLGTLVGWFVLLLETYHVFAGAEGRRLGDRWAGTRVVSVQGERGL